VLLEGKVAVVSGAGPGLGRDVALGMAAEGADVVLAARRPDALAKVAAEVTALGRRAVEVPCDITDPERCDAVAERALEELGRVDILVNNAFHGGDFRSFMDGDLEEWRRTMDVNFFGTLAMTKALVPALEASGDGRIVMVNTMSMQRIQPKYGAYAASKGALATATRTLALELGPRGIRVNGVHPGYIYGDSVEWYLNHLAEKRGITFQEIYDELAGETCLGYLPPSAEIAGAVVFFASPLAKPITGQSLAVNCGHWTG
jgi:NAD(P)-dependent dehydrogenase (short-subunit alcohol dehydrogenase family)